MGNSWVRPPRYPTQEANEELLVTGTQEETFQLSGAGKKYSNSDNENVQPFLTSASPDEAEATPSLSVYGPSVQEEGQQNDKTEISLKLRATESNPQSTVEEVNTNRHQCKRSSKIFIIAIVIGTVVLFLLLALLIALVVYIFEIPHLNNKSTQQVYKKENISLVKLFDVDPSELNKWSVTVMDETVADYSVNVYSVKCSELTTKSREIKRRVIDKYYPAPILPNNGIIIGTFLYLLPGSYLNYTFSIKTNSTTDEGVIGTLLEYADLDYNKDNVTPEKKTMVYANTTLSVSIKKARYLLSVLEVTTQGDFTLSYEWNAFQLYWNETQYNPPYCTLESPDTATCSKKLHKMGEKQCVLAFTSRSRGPDSPLELSIFISSSNIDIVIALSCIAVAIFVCTCAVVIACIVSCCCKHICKRYYS